MVPQAKTEFLRNARRRLYAFAAVALAVFLLGITSVGIALRGYAMEAEAATANAPSGPRSSADEVRSALSAANGELTVAADAAASALQVYETANSQLTAFMKSHLSELQSAQETQTAAGSNDANDASGNSQPISKAPVAPRLIVNPRWTEIHDELVKLQIRRAELLTTMLPSHPAVRAIESSIGEVDSLLSSIVKEIPAPADSSSIQPQIANQPGGAAIDATNAARAIDDHARQLQAAARREAESKCRELSERVDAAKIKYNQALMRESAARKRQHDAEAASIPVLANQPQQRGTASPQSAILLSSLLAVAVGIAIAWRARVAEPTFRSAAEVRQTLGVTILGLLSRRPGESPQERPRIEPPWVSRSVLAAELVLAVAVACLTITAVLDTQFFHSLLQNPLAACSQKFWC